jgi:hypothetical protein
LIYQYAPKRTLIDEATLSAQIDALDDLASPSLDDANLKLLSDISGKLLKSPMARRAPQITVAGYWLRKAALSGLCDEWRSRQVKPAAYAPRGIAFHLPPTNVDTIFLYSWALSVLAGNTNIVRLPSSMSMVASEIIGIVSQALIENQLEKHHLFLEFPHSSALMASISARSSVRMIWGGDNKVNDVSRYPVRPNGISLGFPDRFSFCAIKSSVYSAANDKLKADLAQKFYNDTYWFDQLGCGSPRIIYWIGKVSDGHEASKEFFERLEQARKTKNYETETGVAIQKLLYASRRAADGDLIDYTRLSNELSAFKPTEDAELHEDVQGGGMIAHLTYDNLEKISPRIRAKDQTMTHFGFDPLELQSFARLATIKGLCRIVPIGEALSFEPVWDGIDLLTTMSRIVTIRTLP